MGFDFFFIGVGSILHTFHDFGLESVAFLHQLFHALRSRAFNSGQSLHVAGLPARTRTQSFGFKHHAVNGLAPAANVLFLFA